MSWQDLLNRPFQSKSPAKATIKRSAPEAQPIIEIEPAQPQGFGPQGFMAERPPVALEQPREVHMKAQVMGEGDPS